MMNLLLRGHHVRALPSGLSCYHCPSCHTWHLTKKIAVRAARHRAEIDHRVAHRLAVRERIRYDAARHKIDAALRIEFSPGSRLPNE